MRKLWSALVSLPWWIKILIILLAFPLAVLMGHLSLRLITKTQWLAPLPSQEQLEKINNPLASELYTSDEKLMGRFYTENRSDLAFEEMNDGFKDALIATEDIRYYSHNGVDNRSLLRVLIKTLILQRDASGGGSTITQQLVKNHFGRKKYRFASTVFNKYREMEIARKIEKEYSKEEILLLYANTVSFGERAFGLQTAAKRFFNTTAKELSIPQAATLVGLLKATSYYSPRNHPERSKNRRNVVLSQMHKYAKIDQTDYEKYKQSELSLEYQPLKEVEELARYAKKFIRGEFKNWAKNNPNEDGDLYNIDEDGLKIYTSLDYGLQIIGEKVVSDKMSSLQKIFNDSWAGGAMFGSDDRMINEYIKSDPVGKRLLKQGMSFDQVKKIFSEKEDRFIWTHDGFKKPSISKIDSIKHYLSMLHTGMLASDPQTGAIKMWIGGIDYSKFQFDNVKGARQVGSTFKPIVYLTALEKGVEPCELFENQLRSYTDYKNWTPRNADEHYGNYVTMKGALTHSINTISVQILFKAGMQNIVNMAKRMGINSPLNQVPSMVLGTSDISLFEMVKAYSVIANGGYLHEPYIIEQIRDKENNILYSRETKNADLQTVTDSSHVETIKEMLYNVTKNGTGRRLYSMYDIPAKIGGKTGTTQNQSDGWYLAFHKNLVIGAWVGTTDRRIHFRNLGTGSGGRTALPLVASMYEYASLKNLLSEEILEDLESSISCPDTLSPAEYVQYSRSQKWFEKDVIAGLPGKWKKTQKTLPKSRQSTGRKTQDRKKKTNIFEETIQKWESKLKNLEKDAKKRRENRGKKKR